MQGEYKRPTKIIDLPSGKKVEIVSYFSKYEIEKLSALMLEGKKIRGEDLGKMGKDNGGDAFNNMEFDFDKLTSADSVAREMAIVKLIDIDGKEYEATEKSIRDFLDEIDGTVVTNAINETTKKKQTEAK
jgi:hypothetical protein